MYKVDAPNSGNYLNYMSVTWLGVALRWILMRHVFKRDWTCGLKYEHHSRFNSQLTMSEPE